MASASITRLDIKGYGQVELNNVAFRRDGRIEAQCKAGEGMEIIENGMLLAIDSVNKTVAPATNGDLPIALVYSAEHVYDEKMGLKNFKLNAEDDHLPRLGYLAVGDKFTTNCVEILGAFEDVSAGVYAGACETGAIRIFDGKPEFGPVLEVVKKTTMPDGQKAIQFRVLKA